MFFQNIHNDVNPLLITGNYILHLKLRLLQI